MLSVTMECIFDTLGLTFLFSVTTQQRARVMMSVVFIFCPCWWHFLLTGPGVWVFLSQECSVCF